MTTTAADQHHRPDDGFDDFAARTAVYSEVHGAGPFFTVDAGPLYEAYLLAFPEETRQTFRCHACRRFLEQFGSLVTIDEHGVQHSVFWGWATTTKRDVPAFLGCGRDIGVYRHVARVLCTIVEAGDVKDVFLSGLDMWGTPTTLDSKRDRIWHHFAKRSPRRWDLLIKTADQRVAELHEEHNMLSRAIGEYSLSTLGAAVMLLEGEQLYRGERTLGVARWLHALKHNLGICGDRRPLDERDNFGHRWRNLLWRATASAPTGFAHVRSGMIGTLLDDLQSGMAADAVKARFAEKMHPLQYQRPTAPPSDSTIAQAEKLVAELGIAPALDRRFAKLEEIETLWKPAPDKLPPAGGVFDHLRSDRRSRDPDVITAALPMTWEKFAREVLPKASGMGMKIPRLGAFIAITTAARADAPPILQWDSPERRNPFAWYVYVNGSQAERWNLAPGHWVNVLAVTMLPPCWPMMRGEKSPAHQGRGVILVLDGMRDLAHLRGGGFFPDQLRAELHPVRRVLEAHALQAPIAGRDDATACGYDLRQGAKTSWDCLVRVSMRDSNIVSTYRLDRWD